MTHDITRYCKAKVFSHIGKRTPIAVRFSTVGESPFHSLIPYHFSPHSIPFSPHSILFQSHSSIYQSPFHTVSVFIPFSFSPHSILFQSPFHTVSVFIPFSFNPHSILFQSPFHSLSVPIPTLLLLKLITYQT